MAPGGPRPLDQPLYRVERSSLVAWFHRESAGSLEQHSTPIQHYFVNPSDDCYDFLTWGGGAPQIEWTSEFAA